MGFSKSQARPFGDIFLCFRKTQLPKPKREFPDTERSHLVNLSGRNNKTCQYFLGWRFFVGGNVRDETTGSTQSVCVCNKNAESEMESPGERRRKSQQAKINKSIKLTKLCDRFSSR